MTVLNNATPAPADSGNGVEDEGLQPQAPQAQAPAAAPVEEPAPAAPAPATAEPAPAPEPAAPVPTGVPELDSVANVLAGAGVKDVNAAISELAEKGELSLETKARMMAEGDPAVVNMAIAQGEAHIKGVKDTRAAEGAQIREHAAKALGATAENAEQVWAQVGETLMSEAFTDSERAALNSMLSSADTGKFAVDTIVARMQAQPGFVQQAELLGGTVPSANGFEPLTKTDYQSQMAEAQAKYGEGSPQVNALRQRREVSLRRGF